MVATAEQTTQEVSFEYVWSYFGPKVESHLQDPKVNVEDDPALWKLAVSEIVGENAHLFETARSKQVLLVQIGSCSHWLRPHQTRRTIAGGFAHPSGYGDGNYGFSRRGLPELNWSLTWRQIPGQKAWEPVNGRPGRRPLVLRIALPTRTARHQQAAVHTRWEPGSPADPKTKIDQLYFFRKLGERWERVAEILDDPADP